MFLFLQFHNSLNIKNSEETNDKSVIRDEVTLTLTIIMLLWRNGADPKTSYKLGEKQFPVNVDINCSIVALLLSKFLRKNIRRITLLTSFVNHTIKDKRLAGL